VRTCAASWTYPQGHRAYPQIGDACPIPQKKMSDAEAPLKLRREHDMGGSAGSSRQSGRRVARQVTIPYRVVQGSPKHIIWSIQPEGGVRCRIRTSAAVRLARRWDLPKKKAPRGRPVCVEAKCRSGSVLQSRRSDGGVASHNPETRYPRTCPQATRPEIFRYYRRLVPCRAGASTDMRRDATSGPVHRSGADRAVAGPLSAPFRPSGAGGTRAGPGSKDALRFSRYDHSVIPKDIQARFFGPLLV
jgi:hypothetical protein